MKNNVFKLSGFILMILTAWSCSKTETATTPTALKDALTSSAQNLNTAMTDIASSQAFQLLSVSSSGMTTMKSGTVYSANIPLDVVKGVYDYKALKTNESKNYALIKFFTKTADPGKMVVNMPLAKMKNPNLLRAYLKSDSTLTNNFSITVTDYHNNYNSYRDYDYVNVADISIDKANAGSLNIKSLVSPTTGTQYASQFVFSNGYTAQYLYTSGDTINSSFTLLQASSVLYKEELLTIKNDTARFGHEKQYSLTIGDVKLVSKSDHTTLVYVKNILQPKATVTVVDKDGDKESESEHSICNKRDLQITFEDGTTSTISALIGSTISDLSTLFTSLHQVYFAAYVVDWLGYDIYYKR
jgi:hypothetical protein